MSNGEYKGVKIGAMVTNSKGNKTIKLGSAQEGEYAKYNYTVQVRVLKGTPKTKEEFKDAEVLASVTNPWVNLIEPKAKEDGTKSKVHYELQVFTD